MFKKAGILFFYTITPLHPGSGASIAEVDLPIQRERHTNFPIIQASGVKGALRDLAKDLSGITDKVEIVFGPETDRASEHGGALALTDARILLFPVRSVRGVFTWITCPSVIARLCRDLKLLKINGGQQLDIQPLQEVAGWRLPLRQAVVPKGSSVELQVAQRKQIVLEDFCFDIDEGKQIQAQQLAEWLATNALPDELDYWIEKLKKDLVVLSDEDFQTFVEMSTEIITRIKLGEKGTVETGPWDEEHLPSETLLYSLALATDPKLSKEEIQNASIKTAAEVLDFVRKDLLEQAKTIQFGGDETVGKGLVWVRFFDGKKKS
jgi:CRISPR-associated protein Cmr4